MPARAGRTGVRSRELDEEAAPGLRHGGGAHGLQRRRSPEQGGVLVLSQYVEPGYAMRLIGDRPEGVGYLLNADLRRDMT